jgi:phage-related minor tail protein
VSKLAQKKYEVSFQLGGEVQGSFSRAFSSAQDKFRGTEKSAKHLNDQVDNSTRKFGGLTSMFHKTSSGASAMTSSLKTAAGAIAGLYVVKKGIDVGKTLIDQYQSSFRIIKTGTGAAGKNLDGLIDSYHNLGAVVPDDLKDVATVMSDFNTRVGATGKVLEDLTGKTLSLSAIASADLGETVKQSTRMFGDWSIPLEKGGETLDKLYITSQNTGIGIEALAEKMTTFGGPLRQMGFDFETSMAIMGKWEKEGVNAELVLGSLRIALGKMAKAGVKDTNKALNIVIDKVQKAKTTGRPLPLQWRLLVLKPVRIWRLPYARVVSNSGN